MTAMTQQQLDFFRELCAPFHESQTSRVPKGGRTLTYIDSRAVMNRLDEVAGPTGWYVEYRATERGYTARLSISCPNTTGHWSFIAKEDGGGFEDMGSKDRTTGEWETDIDNDEKSAYTNAFRRAASVWGIGRSYYQKGVPAWMDGAVAAAPSSAPAGNNPAKLTPSQPPATPPTNGKNYDNFRIPRPGKGVFAWAKGLESHFGTSIINGMKDDAKRREFPTMFTEWDQEQVHVIAGGVIAYIKTLDNYAGEFDAISPASAPAAPTDAVKLTAPANLAAQKKEFVHAVSDLIQKQTGREASPEEIKAMIVEISAEARNKAGAAGEVLGSLRDCQDGTWISNMASYARMQLESSAEGEAADDDIPF